MTFVLAILVALILTLLFGVVLPVCGVLLTVWLFDGDWNWRQTSFILPIALLGINAPAYSAAMSGLLDWDLAFHMHPFAIVWFGIACLVKNGNATEGYAVAFLTLSLTVSILVVRTALRDDSTTTPAESALLLDLTPDSHRRADRWLESDCCSKALHPT